MMRKILALFILGFLLTSQGYVQDSTFLTPAALHLEITDAPETVFVAGKPAILQITVLNQYGRPVPVNGLVAGLKTSDARSKLNNTQVPIANGVAQVKVQWFTTGTHSIEAVTKEGLQGRLANISVQPLPTGAKLEVSNPQPWPKYVYAGGVFKVQAQLTSDDGPVECVEVSIKHSRGVRVHPNHCYTEEGSGVLQGDIFTPPVKNSSDGSRTLDGDARMTLQLFVDTNGNGTVDTGELSTSAASFEVVDECPQELIPAAFAELCALVSGNQVTAAGTDNGVVISSTQDLTEEELEKIKTAKNELKSVIKQINSGNWNGQFSKVATRLEAIVESIFEIDAAEDAAFALFEAADIIEDNTDVKSLKLSLQRRPKEKLEVPVGFKSQITVQSLDKRNNVITNFEECLTPFLTSVDLIGPALITSFRPERCRFGFKCTGRGKVEVIITKLYRTEVINDFPDAGGNLTGTLVPAKQVLQGGKDFDGGVQFTITEKFLINQKRCEIIFLSATNLVNGNTAVIPGGARALTVCNGEDVGLETLTGLPKKGKRPQRLAGKAEWAVFRNGEDITDQLKTEVAGFDKESLNWVLPGIPGTYEIFAFCDDDDDVENNPENNTHTDTAVSIFVTVLNTGVSVEDFQDRVVPKLGSRTVQVKSPDLGDDDRVRLTIRPKSGFQSDNQGAADFAGKASFSGTGLALTKTLPPANASADEARKIRTALKSDTGLTVTIFGRETSKGRRRLELVPELLEPNEDPAACGDPLDFTVFIVKLTARPSGTRTDPLADLTTADGPPAGAATCPPSPEALRTFIKDNTGQSGTADSDTNLGVILRLDDQERIIGSQAIIYIRGTIEPKDLLEADFFPGSAGQAVCSRAKGFNFVRRKTTRTYDGDNCLLTSVVGNPIQRLVADDITDDRFDSEEDLIPKADRGATNGLMIHVVDPPTMSSRFTPSPGDKASKRLNFREWVEYRGSRCSEINFWAVRFNAENVLGSLSVSGRLRWGGTVQANGSVSLDPAEAKKAQAFRASGISFKSGDTPVTKITPGSGTLTAEIAGGPFVRVTNCPIVAYLVIERAGTGAQANRTLLDIIEGNVTTVARDKLTVSFNFTGKPIGEYTLKVFNQEEVGRGAVKVNVESP